MELDRSAQVPVVYIVDDDRTVRAALIRLVESMGMHAVAFGSPEDFLTLSPGNRPACLLFDIQLPGMDGFELHERAVEAGHEYPVIFITGHPSMETRSRATEARAVAFLEKPLEDEVLLDAIEEALDRQLGDPTADPASRGR